MSQGDPRGWSDADAAAARGIGVWPLDTHNKKLLDAVHPYDWKDPEPKPPDFVYDLIAIGAGAGGLVSSKQSGRRGAKSAMISEHLAGGDCLNVGCVPSKALLHCAKVARDARDALQDGLLSAGSSAHPPLRVDFGAVMARMRRLRAQISPADSHEATQGAGADVYQGRGRFVARDAIEVNGRTLRFKKAVVATGGRAVVPPIPGLEGVPYMTNASLFNLTELPRRLGVLGAGAIALEMAQAFACFGSEVTVFVRGEADDAPVLRREPEAASRAIEAALAKDGVAFRRIRRDASATRVAPAAGGDGGRIDITWTPPPPPPAAGADAPAPSERTITVDALLVATGRTPNVEGLGLDAAGVRCDADGVVIDDYGASSNPNVFAVGDCASGVPRFTHASGEMAKLVVQNDLFGDAWRVSSARRPAVRLHRAGVRERRPLAPRRRGGGPRGRHVRRLPRAERSCNLGGPRGRRRLRRGVHRRRHRRGRRRRRRRARRGRHHQRGHARDPGKGRPRDTRARHPSVPHNGGGRHGVRPGLHPQALEDAPPRDAAGAPEAAGGEAGEAAAASVRGGRDVKRRWARSRACARRRPCGRAQSRAPA